ncbi:allantoinase AllB [Angustibacter sp. McL0619]|uniref:allantoinase AllB n=1 Tax=Angustibacter sp. McL0619 TaxID=3415676 RepID=UPI003CEFC671
MSWDEPAVDLVVRAGRAVVDGTLRAVTVLVDDGRIIGLREPDAIVPARSELVLADDEVLLPGLVDTHVHVNEPGRTNWEGFASATRAAAAGGVTTLVDMPLNSIPPTVDLDALRAKRRSAQHRCGIDVAFWAGAVPSNLGRLKTLHDNGVIGFKCFLVESGVEEFPALDDEQLAAAMAEVAAFDGLLLVHAEDGGTIAAAPPAAGRLYRDFLASRPAAAEDEAIATVIDLARRTGARVHVVHLSSAGSLDQLAAAQHAGVRISAETCPHYLSLAAQDVPDGATEFKCCPPIRDRANQDGLWAGLRAGTVSMVVSDHSPCPPELKHLADGDLGAAWGGISSVQLGLPVVWTAARSRGHLLPDVVRWMAEAPAALVGLRHKGRIAVGCDADLVVLAPDATFEVRPDELLHRHPLTPYAGRELTGVVRRTLLRGAPAGAEPRGRLLSREDR